MPGASTRCFWIGLAVLMSATTAGKSQTELPPLIPRPAAFTVSKPGQMALAPGGDRAAVSDRFGNRIFIFDSRGELLWSVGDGVALAQPTALVWTSDKELIFSQWDSRVLLRVAEDDPRRIDTVVDLTSALGDNVRILRIYPRRDRTFLVLTEKPDGLWHFDIEWKKIRVLIEGGSGRNKLGRASACAQLASGRLAVVGDRTRPVQIFDADGRALVTADWSQAAPQTSWEASAVTVDIREMIWVADVTNSQFRRYDPSGTLLDTRPFAGIVSRPVDMEVTADNKLLVANETGRLEIYDLSLEQ